MESMALSGDIHPGHLTYPGKRGWFFQTWDLSQALILSYLQAQARPRWTFGLSPMAFFHPVLLLNCSLRELTLPGLEGISAGVGRCGWTQNVFQGKSKWSGWGVGYRMQRKRGKDDPKSLVWGVESSFADMIKTEWYDIVYVGRLWSGEMIRNPEFSSDTLFVHTLVQTHMHTLK